MLHKPFELSTCVTVFFLNSSIIKVTEGSCCSLEIVGIEKNYFSPTHLEPAGSACLSSLVIERNTGKGANGPAIIQFFCKSWKFLWFLQICNLFHRDSALLEIIDCHWIGLVAVVLKASQSAYTPASPPFNLCLKIISFIFHSSFFVLLFSQAYLSSFPPFSSSRWPECPSGAFWPCWSQLQDCPR